MESRYNRSLRSVSAFSRSWGSSKGVRGLMLDGMCGVMREDNLGRGFTEIGYVPKSRVILKKNR